MGLPSDGKYSCYTTMSRDDFFLLYSGKASPTQVASMCLSGRMKVKWWRYHELQQFASAFTYSTPNWIMFYRLKGKDELMQNLLNLQWEKAIKENQLVDNNGFIVNPDKLDPNVRAELEKVREKYLHPQPVIPTETILPPEIISSPITSPEEIVPSPIPSVSDTTIETETAKPMEETVPVIAPLDNTNEIPAVVSKEAVEGTPSLSESNSEKIEIPVTIDEKPSEEVIVEEEPKSIVTESSSPSPTEILSDDVKPPAEIESTVQEHIVPTPEIMENQPEYTIKDDNLIIPPSPDNITTETIIPNIEKEEIKAPSESIIDEAQTAEPLLNTNTESISASIVTEPTISARILVPDITSAPVVKAAAAAATLSTSDNAIVTNESPSSSTTVSIEQPLLPSVPSVPSEINESIRSKLNESADAVDDITALLRLSELIDQPNISSSILQESNISVLEYPDTTSFHQLAESVSLDTYLSPIDKSINSLIDLVETNLTASLACESELLTLVEQQQQKQKQSKEKSSFFSFGIPENTNGNIFSSVIQNWFSSSKSTSSTPVLTLETINNTIKMKQQEQYAYDTNCASALQQIANEIEQTERSQINGHYLSLLLPRVKPIAAKLQSQLLFPLMYINTGLFNTNNHLSSNEFLLQSITTDCFRCQMIPLKWPILPSIRNINQLINTGDIGNTTDSVNISSVPNNGFQFTNLDSLIFHQVTHRNKRNSVSLYHNTRPLFLSSTSAQIYNRLRTLLDTINNNKSTTNILNKEEKVNNDSKLRTENASLLDSLTSSSFSILKSTHAEGMGPSHNPYHPANSSSASFTAAASDVHDIDDIRAQSYHASSSDIRIVPDGSSSPIEVTKLHQYNVPMDGALPSNPHTAKTITSFNNDIYYVANQFKRHFHQYSIWDSVLDLAKSKRTNEHTYHYGLDTFRDGLYQLPLFLPSFFFNNEKQEQQISSNNLSSSLGISTSAYNILFPWLQKAQNNSVPTVLTNMQHIETFLFCLGIPFCPLSSRAPVTLGALEVKFNTPITNTSSNENISINTEEIVNNAVNQLQIALLPIWRPKRLIHNSLTSITSSNETIKVPTGVSSAIDITQPGHHHQLPTVYNGLGSAVYLQLAKQRLRLQFEEAMHKVSDDLGSSSSSLSTSTMNKRLERSTDDHLYGFGDETLQSVGPPLSSLIRKDIPSTVVTDIVRTLRKQGVWKLYGRAKALDAFTADSHSFDTSIPSKVTVPEKNTGSKS